VVEAADPPSWEAVYRRSDDVVLRNIAGENLLVPVAGDLARMQAVWVLNPVAAFIWEHLDGERSMAEIRDQVLDEFAVDYEEASADLLTLLSELQGTGLVKQ
jgi:hypothetical protein